MEIGGAAAGRAALDAHAGTLDELVKVLEDDGLAGLDKAEVVGFVREFERLRDRTALVDHQIVRDGQRRGINDALCQVTLPRTRLRQ